MTYQSSKTRRTHGVNRTGDSHRRALLYVASWSAIRYIEARSKTVLSWLRSPLRELDYQTPLQALDTVTGYTLVNRVLGRIDHGIFG